jgi:hypothetical protein
VLLLLLLLVLLNRRSCPRAPPAQKRHSGGRFRVSRPIFIR